MQKQLENTPSIKDLQVAEKLELLKQFNNNNNNKNNDDNDNDDAPFVSLPPFPPPAYPSSNDTDESNIEGEYPVQKFFIGGPWSDRLQRERIAVAVGKKTATAAPKKVKFSENLSEVFPKADEFFDNELKNDDINYDELSEVTIPNTQSLFKELNHGKIPDDLKYFSGGNEGANALTFHAIKNVGSLYESNDNFLDYLLSDFGSQFLSKNKMKIHLDSGNIYYNDLNMRERVSMILW